MASSANTKLSTVSSPVSVDHSSAISAGFASSITTTSTSLNGGRASESSTSTTLPTTTSPLSTSTAHSDTPVSPFSSTSSLSSSSLPSHSSTFLSSSAIISSTTIAPISSPSYSHTSSSGSSISPGALAGGVVGAALGGALLAFILTLLFLSSRKKRQTGSAPFAQEPKYEDNALPPTQDVVPTTIVDSQHSWETHLPQPADDVKLRQAVKTLYDLLELHVENFYTDTWSSGSSPFVNEDRRRTAISKVQTPFLSVSPEVLLQEVTVKTAVIKHCLSYLVVSGIDINNANPTFPLLPSELTSIRHAANRGDTNRPAFAQALAFHGQLSSYLLSPVSATLPHYAAQRDAVIAFAAETISLAFAPWANNSTSIDVRIDNLSQILRQSSETGIMLCAQPDQFIWDWQVNRRDTRRLIVAPAFFRSRTNYGRGISQRPEHTELLASRMSDL